MKQYRCCVSTGVVWSNLELVEERSASWTHIETILLAFATRNHFATSIKIIGGDWNAHVPFKLTGTFTGEKKTGWNGDSCSGLQSIGNYNLVTVGINCK